MSHPLLRQVVLLLAMAFSGAAYCLPPFQLFVDITPEGGTLRPMPGTYGGPVVIRKKITIEGNHGVTIDGEGQGTVMSVLNDDVVVRGLKLVNSGQSHDQTSAGILVNADNVLIEDNRLENVLFGIHLRQTNDSIIRNNHITSIKTPERSLRGEGIRIWYSSENLIENNEMIDVRDMVIANSSDNRIIGNHIRGSRIGMEFIFSPGNLVQNNIIDGSDTGIVVVYSHDLEIKGNRLSRLRKLTGFGISIKGSASVLLEHNEVVYCAIGFVANAPIHPENVFTLQNNHFAYNDIAIFFYGEKGGHKMLDNRFENNFTDVVVSASSSALKNNWKGNYWDNYQGFDTDNDGYGDHPYRLLSHSDRIWMDRPSTRFFRGSPLLDVIDFIERLAPFDEPVVILQDPRPAIQ